MEVIYTILVVYPALWWGCNAIIVGAQNQSVLQGKDVRLLCYFSDPEMLLNCKWYFSQDGNEKRPLTNGTRYMWSCSPDKNWVTSQISFKNAIFEDTGKYTCEAIRSNGTEREELLLTVHAKPEITVPKTKYTAAYGTNVTLECVVNAIGENITFTGWQHWIHKHWYNLSQSDKYFWNIQMPSLFISNVTTGDSHSYRCFVSTTLVTVKGSDIYLNVQDFPLVNVQNTQFLIISGNDVVLQCTVDGRGVPIIKVMWYRRAQASLISLENNTKYSWTQQGVNASIRISKATKEDAGIYVCEGTSEVGSSKGQDIELRVGSKPEITVPKTKYTAAYGTNVTLECVVNAIGETITFTGWQHWIHKQWYNLSQSDKYFWNIQMPSLFISNVTTEDSRSYRCFVSTTLVTVKGSDIYLNVQDFPLVNVQNTQFLIISGNDVVLQCTVDGRGIPIIKVMWYRRAQASLISLENNTKYSWTQQGVNASIRISKATKEDAGIYVCEGTSEVGSSKGQDIELRVGSKPEITVPKTKYTAAYGTNVTLECVVNAIGETITFTGWQHWIHKQWYNLSQSDKYFWNIQMPSLFISNVTTGDSRSYRCFVSTTLVTVKGSDIYLNVQDFPLVNVQNTQFLIISGNDVVLQCTVDGRGIPIIKVMWYRRAQASLISLENNTKYSWTQQGVNASIRISKATKEDAGIYVCEGTSEVGSSKGQDIELRVGSKPEITVPKTKYTAAYGTNVTLECVVNAIGETITFTGWQHWIHKQWYNLSQSDKYFWNIQMPSLFISNVTTGDSRSYRCFVSTTLVTVKGSDIYLNVQDFPLVNVQNTQFLIISGNDVVLQCTVDGRGIPIIKVMWYRRAQASLISLENNTKYSWTQQGVNASIRISKATKEDAGIYVCEGTSEVGSSKGQDIELRVGSKPEITVPKTKYTAAYGTNVTLECVVNAIGETITFTGWQHWIHKQWYNLSQSDKYFWNIQMPSLFISNVTTGDSRSYRCFVSTTLVTVKGSDIYLNVQDFPLVNVQNTQFLIISGNDVVLQCTVDGRGVPIIKVMWYRRAQASLISLENNTKYSWTQQGVNASIRISKATKEDAGIYVCEGTSEVGLSKGQDIELRVGSKPEITVPKTKYTAAYGTNVTLECVVNPIGETITFTGWQHWIHKQWYNLSQSDKYFWNIQMPSLFISNVTTEDSRSYRCFVSTTLVTVKGSDIYLNVQDFPLVNVQNTQFLIISGNDVVLQCTVDGRGVPIIKVMWYRRAQASLISLENNTKYSWTQQGVNASIRISKATKEDAGIYVCEGTSEVGLSKGQDIELRVGSKPEITVPKTKYTAAYGTNVTLECVVNPIGETITFTGWQHWIHKQWYNLSQSDKYFWNIQMPSLFISNVTTEDSRSYRCFVSTTLVTVKGSDIYLNVQDFPLVNVQNTQFLIISGNDVVLQCTVDGRGIPIIKVMWYRRAQASLISLENNTKYSWTQQGVNASIRISKATKEDAGIYVCEGTSEVGLSKGQDIELRVGYKPTVTTKEYHYNVGIGGNLTLHCSIDGHGSVVNRVEWFKDKGSIYEYLEKSWWLSWNLSNPSLKFIDIRSGDAGQYICRGTTEFGYSLSRPISVRVIELHSPVIRDFPTAAVAGGIVGAAVLVIAIVAVTFVVKRRTQKPKTEENLKRMAPDSKDPEYINTAFRSDISITEYEALQSDQIWETTYEALNDPKSELNQSADIRISSDPRQSTGEMFCDNLHPCETDQDHTYSTLSSQRHDEGENKIYENTVTINKIHP